MIQHEAIEQEALFDWAAYNVGKYPELRLLYHIPNGGRRDPKEAAFLKRMGVKAGVPDLCLPVARGGYHGLYIEMKYGQNKPTKEQRKWLSLLSSQGYKTIVCYSWQNTAMIIEWYLSMEPIAKKEEQDYGLPF